MYYQPDQEARKERGKSHRGDGISTVPRNVPVDQITIPLRK